MAISLNIYKSTSITKENINPIQTHDKNIETYDDLDVKLTQKITNFREITDKITQFDFTHENVTIIEIDNKGVPNFKIINAKIYILFSEKENYLFISAQENDLKFVLAEIKSIINLKSLEKDTMIDVETEEIDLREIYIDLIPKDATEVTNTSLKQISEKVQTITIQGTLRDQDGNESPEYKTLKEKAKKQSSIKIMSRKLTYPITLSKNKISSQNGQAQAVSLVDYFEKIIIPFLNP